MKTRREALKKNEVREVVSEVARDIENYREDKVYAEVRKIDERIGEIYRNNASVYVRTSGIVVEIGPDVYRADSLDDLPFDVRNLAYSAILN